MADISRPVGATPSDAELEQFLSQAQQDAFASRETCELHWLVANAVMRGNHYWSINRPRRTISKNNQVPEGTIRVMMPEMLDRFRRKKGALLSYIRPFNTKPSNTGNPDIWRLNRFASGASQYLWERTGFEMIASRVITDVLMNSLSGVMPYWDNLRNEVNFIVIPAWQLFPFPAQAVDDEQLDGIRWSLVVTPEWIKRNLPDAEKAERATVTSPELVNNWESYHPAAFEGYEVGYTFIKPSVRFPRGDQIITVGKKIYRRYGQLNFWLGDQRVLPISVARFIILSDSWWSESYAYLCSLLNKEVNRLMSLEVRRAILKAHPGYLIYPFGAVDPENFKSQFGGAVPYTPSAIDPQMNRPFWLTPPASTGDADITLNRLQETAERFAGQTPAAMGKNVGRLESATAVNTLIRQASIPDEETVRNLDYCFRRTWKMALEIARRKWDTPRIAKVSWPVGMPQVSVAVDRNMLPSVEEIHVVTGLEIAMDNQQLIGFLTQLAQAPIEGGQPILSPEDFRRGLIGMGLQIPGVELMSPDEEQAWIENLMMYGDGRTPRCQCEPDPILENSDTHMRVHKDFAASPAVHSASPEVRQAFRAHLLATAQSMSPVMPGPGAEPNDIRDMDAAELGAQVEPERLGGFLS